MVQRNVFSITAIIVTGIHVVITRKFVYLSSWLHYTFDRTITFCEKKFIADTNGCSVLGNYRSTVPNRYRFSREVSRS